MDETKLKEKWNDLLFGVRRSVRYHTHRRKFFDKLKVWADFLVIVSGGTVVGLATAEVKNAWTIGFGAFIGIIGSFDLVVGFSGRARDHHDLAKEFSELEREMTAVDERTEKELKRLTNRRLQIEEEEPPILQVLNCYCHNELVKALGHPEAQRTGITFLQSVFKQWFDWFPASLEKTIDKCPPPSSVGGVAPQT